MEKGEIVSALFLATACDPLGKGERRGYTGGVFVDIKRVVKVGNVQAFKIAFFFKDQSSAEVFFQEIAVFGAEQVYGKERAAFLAGNFLLRSRGAMTAQLGDFPPPDCAERLAFIIAGLNLPLVYLPSGNMSSFLVYKVKGFKR